MENSNITSMQSSSLLRISPQDNVLIAVRTLKAGTLLELEGISLPLETEVGLGHKIAAKHIPAGAKIIKYGVSIGSATAPIRAGEAVHLHNMKSDYLPTYLRGNDAGDSHEH